MPQGETGPDERQSQHEQRCGSNTADVELIVVECADHVTAVISRPPDPALPTVVIRARRSAVRATARTSMTAAAIITIVCRLRTSVR